MEDRVPKLALNYLKNLQETYVLVDQFTPRLRHPYQLRNPL